MDSKIKDGHRLNVLTNMETKLKTKEKARKELWDSLLAVYEHEVDKENITEIEEVEVDALEEWSMINKNSILRAQTQLAVNLQILSAPAFPDNADFVSESEFEKKQGIHKKKKNKRKEQKNGSKIHKNCSCKSAYVKIKKKISPARKFEKHMLLTKEEELSVSLMSKKKEKSKTKHLNKLQRNIAMKDEDPEVCVEKIRKQKLICLKISKESTQETKVPKSSTKLKKIKLKTEKGSSVNNNHKLQYYLNTNNGCVRSDNRVFNCKLIFKVCHCSESDLIL